MKVFKIILALVLAFSGISSFIGLRNSESGAGLFGVAIGCSIFVVGAILLFRSALKTKKID